VLGVGRFALGFCLLDFLLAPWRLLRETKSSNSLMTRFVHVIVLCFGAHLMMGQSGFLAEQKRYARVREALTEKEQHLVTTLKTKDLRTDNFHLLLVAYKATDELLVYVKKNTATKYELLTTYKICSRSGQLGPKRKEGDGQVPEGFYHIDRFNPSSQFHLSLGLNYPNTADKRKSIHANPGTDIFIHGACITIGCLPMTHDKIKEIYLYAVFAKNNGQSTIPVYIFPFRMSDREFDRYKTTHTSDRELIAFWANLKTGYDKFEREMKELTITVDAQGNYVFR
jgi:murein L,D-transpeptidase YafK